MRRGRRARSPAIRIERRRYLITCTIPLHSCEVDALRLKDLKKILLLRDPRAEQAAMRLGLIQGQRDYTRFIILARARTGSNYLRTLLRSHPSVIVSNEILRETAVIDGAVVKEPGIDWSCRDYWTTPEILASRETRPVAFLENTVFRAFRPHVKAVGFKLFYNHACAAPRSDIWPWLEADRAIHVLHLKRRNLLRVHLSFVQAARTDRWHDMEGRPSVQEPVRLDAAECLACFEQTRAWETEADQRFSAHPKLEVTYEALTCPDTGISRDIQSFLHLEVMALRPRTHKQSRLPLPEAILNYPELKARFAGTPWSSFFDE